MNPTSNIHWKQIMKLCKWKIMNGDWTLWEVFAEHHGGRLREYIWNSFFKKCEPLYILSLLVQFCVDGQIRVSNCTRDAICHDVMNTRITCRFRNLNRNGEHFYISLFYPMKYNTRKHMSKPYLLFMGRFCIY